MSIYYQYDKDIPERGWDVEPCLKVVKDTERFITYCALPPAHEGPCNDGPLHFLRGEA